MDFLTVQWSKLDSLPEFFMLIVGIAAIALAIYYIFTRDKNKVIGENNKATIESYKERLEIVELETKTCHEQHAESLKLILGSTSSAGTGTYRLSFPVTPTTPNAYQDLQPIGTAMITDSGLFNAYSYPVFRTGVTSYYELGIMDKSVGTYNWVTFGGWSATTFTHNTSDLIRTHIIYEAA